MRLRNDCELTVRQMLLNTTTIAGGGVLKNDLAKRGILAHFINVLSCYCTRLCSQPVVIFNYLCLPCDCIFPQLFSVLLIVFPTNIISFLFWDWGFTQHTQQRVRTYAIETPTGVDTCKFPNTVHLVANVNGKIISPPRIKLQTRCAKPNLKRNSIQTTLRLQKWKNGQNLEK